MNLRSTNLSTLLVLLSDKLEYTVKTYYKITAVYSENYIKHKMTVFFPQQHAVLYMLNQDVQIVLFFSLKYIGIHVRTHPHSHTRIHTHTMCVHARTHTHTHAYVWTYIHTYIHTHTHKYYIVTTGLSTVHISHKYQLYQPAPWSSAYTLTRKQQRKVLLNHLQESNFF